MAATSRVEEAIEEVKRTRYVPAYSALDQYVAEMAARESQQQGRADTEAPAGPALQPEARKVQCYVKGDRLQQKVGCCPFSLRALMALETKGVPYTVHHISLDNKPSWLNERFEGKVPVIEDQRQWVPNSENIVKYLDRVYPQAPSLAPRDQAEDTLGRNLMPELMEYLKAGTTKGGTDREREAGEKLHGTLQELNDFLTERTSNMDQGAPFFGGQSLNGTDCRLAPQLHIARVALTDPAVKGDGPAAGWWRQLPALMQYLTHIHATEQWQKVAPPHEQIVSDLRKELGLQDVAY